MNQRLLSSLISTLIALAAIPSAAADYCADPQKDAKLSPAATEQRALILAAQGIRYDYNQAKAKGTADLATFKSRLETFKGDILKLVRKSADPTDKAMARQVMAMYFGIANDLISYELQQNPGKVSSAKQFRQIYGFDLSANEVSAIFPTLETLAIGAQLYPNPDGSETLTFADTEIVRLAIRGIGFSKRSIETNYLETAKCLLITTEVSKMAFNQVLRGQSQIDFKGFADKKACGAMTLQEIGRVYLDVYTQPNFDLQSRTALARSLPSFATMFDSGVVGDYEKQKLFDSNEYIAVYLGHSKLTDDGTLRKKNTATSAANMTADIQTQVDKSLKKISAQFNLSDLPLVWERTDILDKLDDVIGDCKVKTTVKDWNVFYADLQKTETIHFYGFLNEALQNSPHNFANMPNALLDGALVNIIYRAKLNAANAAFLEVLGANEDLKSNVALEEVAQEFTDKNIRPVLVSEILENTRTTSSLIAQIKNRYFAELKTISPFEMIRQEKFNEFKADAILVAKYDNPNIKEDQLPFRTTIILGLYDAQLSALSPAAKKLANIIFTEKDHAIAQDLWNQTSQFFDADLAELKIGREVYFQETFGGKIVNYLGGFFGESKQRREDKVAARLIKSDYQNLKYLADRLGIVGKRKKPEFLSDVMKEIGQDIGLSEWREKVKIYRQELQNEVFYRTRLLEKPFRGERFYKSLVNEPNGAATDCRILSGIVEIQENIAKHIKTIASATKTEDLKNYIAYSAVLNLLLGEDGLEGATLSKDFYQSTQTLGLIKIAQSKSDYIFPALLAHHFEIKGDMQRKAQINRELWDEFYETINMAATPIIAAWGMRMFFPYLPRAFGGSAIPRVVTVMYDGMPTVIDGYWLGVFGYLGVDAVVQASRYVEANNDIKRLESLAYSEVFNLEVPLISEDALQSQMKVYEERKSDAKWRGALNFAYFASPMAGELVVRHTPFVKYYAKLRDQRIKSKQDKLDTLRAQGKNSEAINIENGYAATYINKFSRKAKSLDTYFTRLGLKAGTWSPTELEAALKTARATQSAREIERAEVAYERILREIASEFTKIEDRPGMRTSFVRALWGGNAAEANKFIELINALTNAGKK